MKYINILLVIVASFIGLSCEKEDTETRLSQFETPIITGYELRTKSDEIYWTVGTPNIKTGSESNTIDSDYYMCVYPNPSVDFISLVLKVPQSNSEKKVWIVEALYEGDSPINTMYFGAETITLGGYPIYELETF